VNPHEVVLYPVMTESTTRLIEEANKLVFIVNLKAGKIDVKSAV